MYAPPAFTPTLALPRRGGGERKGKVMPPREGLTHVNTVALPAVENAMSRRYLQVLMRWVPVVLQAFNVWPERPHCGHFFGGVFWYGLETSGLMTTLALVASSPEFDPGLMGYSTVELCQIALQRLRPLCAPAWDGCGVTAP